MTMNLNELPDMSDALKQVQQFDEKKKTKKAKRWWDDDGDGKGWEKGEVDGKFKKESYDLTEEWIDASADVSAEYFLDEGLNEEGLEMVMEEVGLEDFLDFVTDPVEELNEERSAEKASSKAPSYAKVKARIDKADAKRKSEGKREYSTSPASKRNYGDEEAPEGKPEVKAVKKKQAPSAQKAATKKKVTASVAKAKKAQPKKAATKQGLKDKIVGAVKKGVARHKAAVGKAKSDGKKMAKAAGEVGKTVKKAAKDFSKAANPKKEIKLVKGLAKIASTKKEELEAQIIDNLEDLNEADIADILARLEKKRISKGGNPEDSPLPAMKKYHAKKKSAKKEEVEVEGEQLDEISADLALKATKKADVERGKAAASGNKERAVAKLNQAKRLYAKQAAKRKKENA